MIKKESIKAFCNIYQLAFDSGDIAADSLPIAIATLLEMGRGRDEERLDANLMKLSEEHSELHKKGKWLQEMKNSESTFLYTQEKHKETKDKVNEYSIKFWSLSMALDLAKNNQALDYSKLKIPYDQKRIELESINNQLLDLTQSISKQQGSIQTVTRALEKKRQDLSTAKAKRSKYPDMNTSEIDSMLEVKLSDEKNKLETYKKEGGTQEILKANIAKIKHLKKEIINLDELISNTESSILHQLDDDVSNILYSINNAFSDVTTQLSASDKQTIKSFTNLFTKNEFGHIAFLNEALGKTSFTIFETGIEHERRVKARELKKDELKITNKEISKQNQAILHQNIDSLISESVGLIESINIDKTAISGIPTLALDVSGFETQSQRMNTELKKDEIEQHSLMNLQSQLKSQFEEINQQIKILTNRHEQFEAIDERLKLARQQITPTNVEAQSAPNDCLTLSCANEIFKISKETSLVENAFKHSFNRLTLELQHSDVDIHKERLFLNDFNNPMQVYSSAYQTLEYDRQQYTNAVRNHNQLVNNQLNELKEAHSLLDNFIREINHEINNKVVSNLSEIELDIKLNPGFLSLLSTLDKHNIQDDSLLEPQFYETLSHFVDRYFSKKNHRLKMKDIISSVTYNYKLSDTGEVVTKSQSGGTTSAITAFVLAVLLNRITPAYVRLNMPIIVDEIGELDSNNTNSTIEQISEHGFSIFCATPNFSAILSQKVGQWIMIDKSVISQPMVPNCHFNVMPEHVERFGKSLT